MNKNACTRTTRCMQRIGRPHVYCSEINKLTFQVQIGESECDLKKRGYLKYVILMITYKKLFFCNFVTPSRIVKTVTIGKSVNKEFR